MEFTKDIYFDNNPTSGKESKITYSGSLFQSGSNNVNIVYGFGESWNNTTTKPMEKTEEGFIANVRMRNFDTFNFCFSNENNVWDNNNYFNYISPILPEAEDTQVDFGTDYSSSIDDIIENILGNTAKQDIVSEKENSSPDKILESITRETLPEIEALFDDLFFESVKDEEKVNTTVAEISMEPTLAKELKEVGKAVEGEKFEVIEEQPQINNNAELIRMFNELFETSKEPISFESTQSAEDNIQVEEPKLNMASFNLDGLVSDLLEPVTSSETSNDKVNETSLFEDLKAHENDNQETSLSVINSEELLVSSRKLGYFYKIRKRIRLAFLKLAKIPKDFAKQLGL